MGTIITVTLLNLLCLGVGYAVGAQINVKQIAFDTQRAIKKKFDTTPVGPIYRPTQEMILENQNPVIKEGKQAFKEAMDKELGL